jgi:hypothetical protein
MSISLTSRSSRSFEKSLKPLVTFAQCSGIALFTLRRNQITSNSGRGHNDDQFVILKMLYSSLVMTSIVFMIFPLLIDPIIEINIYERVVAVIFYVDCLMIAIIFGYISTQLSRLLESWQNYEFQYRDESGFASSKFVFIFMSLAFCEHLLSKFVVLKDAQSRVGIPTFEAFSTLINKSFFEIFPFSPVAGTFVIVACFYSTILWSFSDVFLIVVFLTLTSKIKNFNNTLCESSSHFHDSNFWFMTRNNFFGLAEQIRLTNSVISPLVMITVLNDFYFICHQLLGAFK